MLTIKNIEKINGKQITDKWEVYETDVTRDGSGYVFCLTDVGYYKHSRWYVTLDRSIDEVMGMYRMNTNRNGKLYEVLIRPIDVTPVGIIYYMNCIIANVKKDEDEHNKQSK